MPRARRSNVKFVIDLFASKVSLLALGALTAWLGYSVLKEAYRKHQVQAEIDALKSEILQLEQRNSSLSSLINSFGDPKNVELEAKRRLNLKKPGEEVAVILRDKANEKQSIAQASYEGNDSESIPAFRYKESNDKEILWLANPIKWWQYITSSR